MRLLKSQTGMSILEVLVALFITAVMTAAMFRVYINQHHSWNIQESIIETQQNARAAIDELTRQLRMTGHGVPIALPALEAFNTNPDTIIIHYSARDCDAPIEHEMPNPSVELRCDGHDVSCFYDGQEAYIYDPFVEQGEFFTITEVQNSQHIQHNLGPLSKAYPKGSIILSIDRVKFYIDYTDSDHPNLMIQIGNFTPQVYAENITDLQFRYVLKNGMVVDNPPTIRDVRQIEVTVTGRTPKADVDMASMPYRFRTYESQVYLRNIG